MNKNNELITNIFGEGGKGGGGSAPVEATDTMRNNSFVYALELLSEGQINGLHTNDGQSVFINGTPLQHAPGGSDPNTYNFTGAGVVVRNGSMSQDYIPGFEDITSSVSVGIDVIGGNGLGPIEVGNIQPIPVVLTVSSSTVDAVRVTLLFNSGLKSQDITNGNINGSSVIYRVSKKVTSSGTWDTVIEETKTGVSHSAYSWQVYVPRAGAGVSWDIKVDRLTIDSSTATITDIFSVANIVEIQEHKLSYPGFAYAGLTLDARQFGTQVPVRSYLIDGVDIQIPSNYSVSTHTFTGTWDGTFINAFSDDPAWVLYDLLTNDVYGAGTYGITASQIDKWSFYNASVFNNALVGDGYGGTERRFTFNAVIQARSEMLTQLMNLAGMQNATLVYVNGLITLVQDRPTNASIIVNKSNVIGGLFTYKSTPLNTYTTAANISYTNKNNKYLPTVTNISADATASTGWMNGLNGIDRYGYNPTNIAAYGATTEGQAQRAARWYVYTNLVQQEVVEFSMGLEAFRVRINDVISLHDEDYTNRIGSGRIVSATSTSVTFDRPIIIDGTPSVSVVLPDGITYETHAITTSAGTYTTVNIANAGTTLNQQTGATGVATTGWTVTPTQYCVYNVTSSILPRTFRIIDIKQNTSNAAQVDLIGVYYDKNNYTNIETGVSIPAGVYTLPATLVLSPPLTATFIDRSYVNTSDATIKHSLIISWIKPTTGVADHYFIKWRRDNGVYTTINDIQTTTYELMDVIGGVYDFTITGVSSNQLMSLPLVATHTVDFSGGTGSALNAVTGLIAVGGGTTFTNLDFNIQWTNPSTNNNIDAILKQFQVEIYSGAVLKRTEIVGAVAPGAIQTYLYTYAKNIADGGPYRTLNITVKAVDTKNLTATGTTTAFTNPAPAALTNVLAAASVSGNTITFDPCLESDFKAYLIWRSTSSSFATNSTTLIADTSSNYFLDGALTPGLTYYYKVAAYDNFSKDYTGALLNVSGYINAIPISALQTGTAYLYQWDTVSPTTAPTGTTTWTWATATNATYTGAGSWTTTVPTNPGTSGVLLWVASKALTANVGVATTSVAWTGVPYVAWTGNAVGVQGISVYTGSVYLQTGSAPSTPTGGTYNFSTNTLVAPSGWSITQPATTTTPTYLAEFTFSTITPLSTVTAGTWSTPIIDAVAGAPGAGGAGTSMFLMEIYDQTGSTPSTPAGGTYTFDTDTLVPPSGWTRTMPTSSTTPTYRSAYLFSTTTPAVAVSASTWSAPIIAAQNGATGGAGAPGANAIQTATPTVYAWAATIPSGPTGSPTYTWSTASFGAAPSGWTLTPGTSPSAGYTLWGASVSIIDTAANSTTGFNWSSAAITARGYAGTNGTNGSSITGNQGASAKVAYTVVSSATSPASTPNPYTISGNVVPGANTWGMSETWTTTVPSYSAGQTVYQTNGVYDPATTNSVYGLPFISALKVGSLSALTVNTGALTVTGVQTMSATGSIMGGQTAYGTGNGFFIGYSGGQYKLSLGTGASGLTWDGTTLVMPAASISGTLTASQIDTRNLTIKDAGGTVLFGSGTNLTSTYITPAAGWLNSNVTINSSGALSGGGGGTVTIAGLGYTGALNATFGADWATNVTGASVVNSNISTAATTALWTGVGSLPSNISAAAANPTISLLNSNITINASGALVGGGGGNVTLTGLGASSFATLSQITSANVSTYIAGAAIGTAQVGVLTAGNIGANTIDASKINSNNLTIKDASGNVIFGSSATINASSYMVPATNWINGNITISAGAINGIGTGNGTAVANSNITLSSGGTLSGAGGGTVTIGGLGYTGDLNATYGANWTVNVAGASTVNAAIVTAGTTATYSGLSGTIPSSIANSYISIGSNGVLSGAGGGTVTITGLGYSGDLNANRTYIDSLGQIQGVTSGGGLKVDNSVISIDSAGVLHNAGGGTVTLGGLGAGAFATLNAITAVNASTYISGAAIGSAQIGTAAIGTAAIQNLAVGTLQIGNNSVTIPVSSYTAANRYINGVANQVNMIVPSAGTASTIIISISSSYYCKYSTSGGGENGFEYFPTPITFSITRNGSIIYTMPSVTGSGVGYGSNYFAGMVSATIADSPGAGVWTYAFVCQQGNIQNAAITCMCAMK